MSLLQGLVLRTTGSWYDVQGPDGEVVSCRPAGKLRLKGYRSTNPVAVGDQVDFEVEEDGTGVIRRIEARKNCIVRKSVNLSHESHVVAANLDRAFLVVTLAAPRTSTGFMDRFLVTAEAYGIPTTVVLNKVDALDDEGRAQAEARGGLPRRRLRLAGSQRPLRRGVGRPSCRVGHRHPCAFRPFGRGQKHLDQPPDSRLEPQDG